MKKLRNAIVGLIFGATLCACAVMQVDVDVYKGPLANDTEIQSWSLYAIASAAKVLIVQSRDELEWGTKFAGRIAAELDTLRPHGLLVEYKAGYIPDNANHAGDYIFSNPGAARLNALLRLYDDRYDPLDQPVSAEGTRLVERYERGQRALTRQASQDLALKRPTWRAMKAPDSLRSAPSVPLADLVDDILGPTSGGICDKFRRAPENYLSSAVQFLGYADEELPAGVQSSYPLRTAMYCMQWLAEPIANVSSGFRANQVALLNRHADDMSSNSMFGFLGDERAMQVLARMLFTNPDGVEAQWFRTSALEFSHAFQDSRVALEQLMLDALHQLEALGAPRDAHVADPFSEIGALRELILQLADPRYLVLAVCHNTEWKVLSSDQRTLFRKYVNEDRPLLLAETWSEAGGDPRLYAALSELLRDFPQDGAKIIRAAHEALKKAEKPPQTDACDDRSLSVPATLIRNGELTQFVARSRPLDVPKFGNEFRYGLARGPNMNPGSARQTLRGVQSAFQMLSSGNALGMEQDRLNEGIETLAKRYLESFTECQEPRRRAAENPLLAPPGPCRREEWLERRERLYESLANFAQKMVFIANNEVLFLPARSLKDGESVPDAMRIGQPSGAAAVRASADSSSKVLRPREEVQLDARNYRLLMQSVGNSLLSLLDEAKVRSVSEGRLQLRAKAELDTLRRATFPSADHVLDDIVQTVTAESMAAATAVSTSNSEVQRLSGDGPQKAVDAAKADRDAKSKVNDSAQLDLKNAQGRAAPLLAAVEAVMGTSPEAGTDPIDLKQAVVGDSTEEIEGKAMVEAIVTWLKSQVNVYSAEYQTQPRPARLAKAAAFLEANVDRMGSLAKGQKPVVYEGVLANLRTNKAAADADITSFTQKAKGAEDGLKQATEKLASAEAAAKTAGADREQAAKTGKEAGELRVRLDHTVKVIKAHRARVVAPFAGKPGVEPDDVYRGLRTQLQADSRSASCDAKDRKPDVVEICNAISVMSSRNAPVGRERIFNEEVNADRGENARDVLDRLIAALQYERLNAHQSGSAENVKRLDAALKRAFDDRASMAYLRPASFYLRNSYAVTSLQDGAELGWKNMLTEQVKRGIPFLGSRAENGWTTEERNKVEIRNEVDKQFWQNINHVRVAGSGDTNYAIAKDDVGNWYVKAYESNPEKIVQGMKSLAMFSFGVPNATTSTTGEGQKAEGTASGLDTIFTRYKEKYATQTSADYAQLVSDHKPDNIKAAITAAWEKNVTDANTRGLLAKDLTDSETALLETWKKFSDSKDAAEQASRIVDGLNELLRFRNQVVQKIAARKLDEAVDTQAKGAVDAVIGGVLQKSIATRRAAVKDLGDAIGFVGEAIRQ